MATTEQLLTAEEYSQLPDDGQPTELVRGKVVVATVQAPRHGYSCVNVSRLLGNYVEDHNLGRMVGNGSAIITERSPDSVRGADIAYYSFARLPKGPFPEGYLSVSPEIVFEVRSPSDLWKEILAKVAEYLNAGVLVVGVHDDQTQTITLYRQNELPRVLTAKDELTLPELHADFRVPVARFFE